MREAFDDRLRELQSPWLAVGKDSKDEVTHSKVLTLFWLAITAISVLTATMLSPRRRW